MFGKRFRLFKLFGFQVHVDASWLIIAVLVTWSLASGFFPSRLPSLPAAVYWWMGVAGALGLFGSIVFHEFSHSIVARRFGLPMKGITLFIFGGVAEMEREPDNPRSEFLMAAAGPVASFALAAGFYLLAVEGRSQGWPRPVTAVLLYIGMINGLLAAFNLVPAFPLDGGRIFRSALWRWKGNLRWATRIAARVGTVFGAFLSVLGALEFLRGNFGGGVWYFLIGMFLRAAARESYQQVVLRATLRGETVRRFMNTHPVTVPPWLSLGELVENYVYRYHYRIFPVVRENQLAGCVSTSEIKRVPPDEWHAHSVQEITRPCSAENSIGPDDDAVQALSLMNRTGSRRLMVVEGGRLVGTVALKNLLEFLAVKLDLEGDGRRNGPDEIVKTA